MKIRQAMEIINTPTYAKAGFMVHFERRENGLLISDYFPDKHAGEPLIGMEAEAWDLAEKFAAKTVDHCVNIYVIKADFTPVDGYEKRQIVNRL